MWQVVGLIMYWLLLFVSVCYEDDFGRFRYSVPLIRLSRDRVTSPSLLYIVPPCCNTFFPQCLSAAFCFYNKYKVELFLNCSNGEVRNQQLIYNISFFLQMEIIVL